MASESVRLRQLRTGGFDLPELYVWPLEDSVPTRDVYRLLIPYGGYRCEFRRDSYIGRYAIFNFHTQEEADLTLRVLGGPTNHLANINGKPVNVTDCHPCTKESGLVPDTLFVRNISTKALPEYLYDLFGDYGEILYCNLYSRPDGCSTHYGFVQFASDEAVRAAIKGMNGFVFMRTKMCLEPYYLGQEFADEFSEDAADTDHEVGKVLARHVDNAENKRKLAQKIAKLNISGAGTDCGTDAMLDKENVSREEHADRIPNDS